MDTHKSDDAANKLKFQWDKESVISIIIILLVMAAILVAIVRPWFF